MTEQSPRFLMGVDIGGTFTDGVLLDRDTGAIFATKVLTSQRHEDAALAAIRELCRAASAEMDDVAMVAHATTLASNTVLLRRGGRIALLTNRGFEDILYLAREGRYDTYNLSLIFVDPLVERANCRGVGGRILVDGTEFAPLQAGDVANVAAEWNQGAIEAVAVCFLHSYVEGAHEQQAMRHLRAVLGADLPISLSSEVSPEMREYERACTTALNAYLQPAMGNYMRRLEEGLRESDYRRKMYVMLSSGGLTTAETASRFPVRMLESGPVAGVHAAAYVARMLGGLDAVGLDVGGTTAKISLIIGGQPTRSGAQEVCRTDRFAKGSGLPVQLPSIDLLEIGAGGGSIARVDALGFLQVGPESAESHPGPVCYGLGGEEPTVTDAAAVLGYIDPAAFAGGSMRLNVEAAAVALARLGSEVEMNAEETAAAVLDVLNESMAQAMRVHLAERGQDAAELVLVASGGGGPLHGVEVARKVGIPEVVVPRRPGVLSAVGLVLTPPAIELAQSHVARLDESADWDGINGLLDGMRLRAAALLEGTGVDAATARADWAADLRWIGQTHAFRVPLPPPPYGSSATAAIVQAFNDEAVRLHGATLQETVLEALTWRVSVTGPEVVVPPEPLRGGQSESKTARVYAAGSGWVDVAVLDRESLQVGYDGSGPALIIDSSSTCAVGPGDTFSIDEHGNLRIRIAPAEGSR
jgi:N-methylhydantoinase A/oxoprolinase/acetone carboxylase beta subunit